MKNEKSTMTIFERPESALG